MYAYDGRFSSPSTEREFHALRTVVASAGLLPADRLVANDRHLALIAEGEWDRLTHRTATSPKAITTGAIRTRRWLGTALIRIGRRLEGPPGADGPQGFAQGGGTRS